MRHAFGSLTNPTGIGGIISCRFAIDQSVYVRHGFIKISAGRPIMGNDAAAALETIHPMSLNKTWVAFCRWKERNLLLAMKQGLLPCINKKLMFDDHNG